MMTDKPIRQYRRDPLDMVLHCPACGQQHIDGTCPPHRSHVCDVCGHVWRPADVYTHGVPTTRSRGANDSPPPPPVAHGDTVDRHLDAVLRASGSGLRHYSMALTLEAMRAAMRAAMRWRGA